MNVNHSVKAWTKDVELFIESYSEFDNFHKGIDRQGNAFKIDLICGGEFKNPKWLIGKRILVRDAIPFNFIGINLVLTGEGKWQNHEKIREEENVDVEQEEFAGF